MCLTIQSIYTFYYYISMRCAINAYAKYLTTFVFVIAIRIPLNTGHRQFSPSSPANRADDQNLWYSRISKRIRSIHLSSSTVAFLIWCHFGQISSQFACIRQIAWHARCQRCRICPFDMTTDDLPTFPDKWSRQFGWSVRIRKTNLWL